MPPARSWSVSARIRTLLIVSAAGFLAFLDSSIVNIAFPAIRADFASTSLESISWVLNAYNLVFAAALVPAGRLADRTGRRPLFISGVIVFVVASAACAIAPNAGTLIGARVFQALGAAALVPAAQALYLPLFSREERPKAIALFGAVAAASAAAGPTLGGILVDQASWRWVFLVNVPIGLLAVAATIRWVQEPAYDRVSRIPDVLGMVVLAAALAGLAYGLVEGEPLGWSSSRVLIAFAAFAVLLPFFVWRSKRNALPAVPLELFRFKSFRVATLATTTFGAGFYALTLCNVLFLTTVWGYSPLQAGFAIAPSAVAAVLIAPVAGGLVRARGPRIPLALGALAYGAAVLVLLLFAPARPQLALWLPVVVLAGVGIGLIFSSLAAAQVSDLDVGQFSVGSAIGNASRQIGAVLGVAILIAVLGTPTSIDAFRRGWTVTLVGVLVSGLLAVALPGQPRHSRLVSAPLVGEEVGAPRV